MEKNVKPKKSINLTSLTHRFETNRSPIKASSRNRRMEKSEKNLSPLKKTGKMLEANLFEDIGGERLFGKKETFPENNKVSKVKQNGDEMLRTKRDSKEKKTKESFSNGLEMDLQKREKKGKDQRKKESEPTTERKKKEKKKKETELDEEVTVLKKDKKKKVIEDFDDENFGKKSNGKKGNEKLLGKISTNKNVAQSDFAQKDDQEHFSKVKKSLSNGDAALPKRNIDETELTFDLRVNDESSSLNVESKNDKNLSESLPQNDSLLQTEENKSKKKKSVSEDGVEDKRRSRSRILSDRSPNKKMTNGSKGSVVSRSLSPSKDKKKKKEDSLGDEFDSSSWKTKKMEKEKRKEADEVERKEKEAEKVEKEKGEIFGNDNIMLFYEKEMKIDAEDDDVFLVDSLPRYAKAYILPRVMKKESVDARMKKDETSADPLVRMSHSKIENEEEDANHEAFKFSMLKASLDYESGFVGPAPVPTKSKLKTRGKKNSTGSGDKSDEVSGRTSSLALSHGNSTGMSVKKSRKTSSGAQNCTGPGSIGDYASYVKSGGFVPLPVLEPERGVEASLFAQYPGLDALDEDGVFSSGKVANWRQKPNTMEEVHVTIDDQFEKIRQKYGEPTIVIRSEEDEERERQKLFQLNSRKAVTKKRGGNDLLDLSIPAPSFESGYSTWIEGSSVDTVSEASSLKNILSFDQAEHFFSGDNSLLPSGSMSDIKTTKILRDAMTGHNLLGMMEEPKAKFNQPRDFSGADSLDLFIDPIAIFGSDRHPALQEVLQQLDMCKRHRGDLHFIVICISTSKANFIFHSKLVHFSSLSCSRP